MNEPALLIALLGAAVVVATVLLHYEALRRLTHWTAHTQFGRKQRIALLMNALLALHGAEIALFACLYWVLAGSYGPVIDQSGLNWGDYAYFSATVYSTLGFGDLLPVGPARFIAGMESVAGLLLITWSASFTYLEMSRYWKVDDSEDPAD